MNPHIPDDIDRLIHAYLTGDATPDECARLSAWVAESEANADALARAAYDDRRLRDELAAADFADVEPARTNRWRISAAVALAAALALAVTAWVVTNGAGDETDAPVVQRPVVGVITDATDAQWGTEPLGIGGEVRAGELALTSGRVELELTGSGSTLELIGPAELTIDSPTMTRLTVGRLRARSTPGFTVQTPRFDVVDLGTEFGVSVRDDGSGEVHVFRGAVAVESPTQQTELTAGLALRVSTNGWTTPMTADAAAFGSVLPQWSDQGPAWVRYAFDEGAGPKLLDGGAGFAIGPFDGALRFAEPGEEGPDRIAGRFGQALEFDGINDYAETAFPGIGGGGPRTIAFWVRVPRGATPDQAYAMLGYGGGANGVETWQVSWNVMPNSGPIGGLRVGTGRLTAVGSTDLRDGRWHHAAIVFDGETLALYIDGEPDAAPVPASSLSTPVGEHTTRLTLGRNVHGPGFFRGALDEVHVFDHALTPGQVRRLMQANDADGGAP